VIRKDKEADHKAKDADRKDDRKERSSERAMMVCCKDTTLRDRKKWRI
jgi:hypothetical protein